MARVTTGAATLSMVRPTASLSEAATLLKFRRMKARPEAAALSATAMVATTLTLAAVTSSVIASGTIPTEEASPALKLS